MKICVRLKKLNLVNGVGSNCTRWWRRSIRRPVSTRWTTLLIVSALLASPAAAQLPGSVAPTATASVVTVLPGSLVYNAFGHGAIRIVDPESGLDVLFNYGTFDFGPDFVPRFVLGKLDYSLSASWTGPSFRAYQVENRTIVEQQLDLSSDLVSRLYRYLAINYLPENRYYRYDFFFDNCSTRIRDALEAVGGDSLRFVDRPTSDSFRDLLHPYLAHRPFLETGIDMLVGSDADVVASYEQRAFLPVEFMHQLDDATFAGRPLVSRTDTIFVAEQRRSASRLPGYVGWLLLLLVCWASIRTRRPDGLRRTDATLFILSGAAGLVILFMWFATDHVVTDANLNLAWTWPTNVLVGLAVLKRSRSRWIAPYLLTDAIVLSIVAVGWPFWKQDLPDLLFPIVLLLLLRAVERWRAQRHAAATESL